MNDQAEAGKSATIVNDLADDEIAIVQDYVAEQRAKAAGWFSWEFAVVQKTDEDGSYIEGRYIEISSTMSASDDELLAFIISREGDQIVVENRLEAPSDLREVPDVRAALDRFRSIVAHSIAESDRLKPLHEAHRASLQAA